MKKYFIILILFLNFNLFSNETLPLVIEDQEYAYNALSKTITDKLPKRIEILVFDIFLLNGSEEIAKKINDNFKIIMKNKQYIYDYSLIFFNDLKKEADVKKFDFIKNYNEQELLSYAEYINKDAVFIASVTIVSERKKIWDKNKMRFLDKKIALIQGNIFGVETKDSLLRFSKYFYFD
ncbi:MAG TPA: hypothetical protein PLO89_05165 [Spirochaetota bacterium]|nr:hypothetical protein [Spirochaetota bacterium]